MLVCDIGCENQIFLDCNKVGVQRNELLLHQTFIRMPPPRLDSSKPNNACFILQISAQKIRGSHKKDISNDDQKGNEINLNTLESYE